jgi:hypothetical protein
VFERLIALQETHRSEVLEAGARQRQAALWWAVAIYGSLLVLGVLVSGALVRSLTRPLHEAVAVYHCTRGLACARGQPAHRRSRGAAATGPHGASCRRWWPGARRCGGGDRGPGQIAAGNGELAERTAQTADHLHRSVERIEEVTLTLMQTAETALQADRLAAAAAASAARGMRCAMWWTACGALPSAAAGLRPSPV